MVVVGVSGGAGGRGERGGPAEPPDVATSLRPLTDWAPGFRLNLWPAAAEVAGRRGTFDPLLIPPL